MNGGCLACTPCVSLFCTLFNRGGNRRALDYQGRAGIISIVRWNLRPVIFGVDKGQEKIKKKLLVAEKGPFGTPGFDPKIPEKVYVGPFLASFPRT